MTVPDEPEFTDRDIKLIRKSLPSRIDRRRLSLLEPILREWVGTDVPLHRSKPSAEVQRGRVKRLKAVAAESAKLARALDAIEREDEIFWIVREMTLADAQRLSPTERRRQETQLQEVREFLEKLSTSAAMASKLWKQGRGQPRKVAASLVLMDIVAIYEWLTNKKATRQVDRDSKTDAGPFWEFASALWPMVFGSADDGLPAAIKNWAAAQKDMREGKIQGERSPVLYNIAMRHPDWGIFGE